MPPPPHSLTHSWVMQFGLSHSVYYAPCVCASSALLTPAIIMGVTQINPMLLLCLRVRNQYIIHVERERHGPNRESVVPLGEKWRTCVAYAIHWARWRFQISQPGVLGGSDPFRLLQFLGRGFFPCRCLLCVCVDAATLLEGFAGAARTKTCHQNNLSHTYTRSVI